MKVKLTVELHDGRLCNYPYPCCPFLQYSGEVSTANGLQIDSHPLCRGFVFGGEVLKVEGHNEVLRSKRCRAFQLKQRKGK